VRVTVVGCSGSIPGPDAPASCYLVEADGVDADGQPRTWRVVLDLGNGALGALQRYVDPASLDGVLLSHLHPDHCLDLCGLYVLLRYRPGASRTTRLPVWGPAGTADRMARAYDLGPRPGMTRTFDFSTYRPGEPLTIGPLIITPVPVRHPVPAFGLRVEHAGKVLAYTGDTDSCESLKSLCRNASMVLADSAFVEGRDLDTGIHLSGRRAAEAAVEAGGVERLVLTHLPPWNDPQVCLAEARAVWDGPLEVAVAGSTYDL
jgi:ribonuclease BN (tRNA processing enzyme)